MTTDMNKIAEKIQKLFALAGNNPNENEAKAALLKAQKLIAQYNVDMSSFSSEEVLKCSLEMSKVKPNPRNNQLAMILASSFACKCIISDKHLCFFGREDNAKAAKSAMEFAHRAMESGMNKICRQYGLTGTSQKGAAEIYNPYALGFIRGLKECMDAQTVALAVVIPEDVKEAFNERFPNLGKYHGRGMQYGAGNAAAYEQGRVDGHSTMGKRTLSSGK